ncbi:MAG: PAS domain-containing protein [Actinobacteria bacterium]|nr:PAS domain-containing protein [Actinomycetota bacterium]
MLGRRNPAKQLSLLLDQLPHAFIWSTDTDLRLTGPAGQALTLLGIDDPSLVVGRRLERVVSPAEDGGAAIMDAHRRALAGESTTFVQPWKRWAFDVFVEPVRENGVVVGVGGISLDASRRLVAEHALLESEARFRTLVERLPKLVTYVNPLGFPIRTTYISPQIEDLLGYPAERWLHEDDFWISRLHPEDRERMLQVVSGTHAAEATFSGEYRLIAADGRVVHVRDETVPVYDERGNALFLQGFLIEVGAQADDLDADAALASG